MEIRQGQPAYLCAGQGPLRDSSVSPLPSFPRRSDETRAVLALSRSSSEGPSRSHKAAEPLSFGPLDTTRLGRDPGEGSSRRPTRRGELRVGAAASVSASESALARSGSSPARRIRVLPPVDLDRRAWTSTLSISEEETQPDTQVVQNPPLDRRDAAGSRGWSRDEVDPEPAVSDPTDFSRERP